MLGSILSNLLLVLGMCFLVGGIRHKVQEFNQQATKASGSLLFLSCIAIILPTLVHLLIDPEESEQLTKEEAAAAAAEAEANLSYGTALVLVFMYLSYLAFQLFTHVNLFVADTEEDEPSLSMVGAILTLTGITVVVAFASEYLTGVIEVLSDNSGLS